MKKILLLCSAGMSTSMIVKKMQDKAKADNIDAEIEAASVSRFEELADSYDIFLLGPQVKYLKDELAKKANQLLRTNQINLTEISSTYNTYMKMMDVLGLKFEVPNINQEDIYNYEQYQQFRLQKDYANSDIYRIKLIEKGLI